MRETIFRRCTNGDVATTAKCRSGGDDRHRGISDGNMMGVAGAAHDKPLVEEGLAERAEPELLNLDKSVFP